jgi:glucose-6-phosphate dehydrogenase assembly protein OpcA
MPDTTQLESFTAGQETAVDLAEIQRQLKALWQLAAESEKDPARRHVTRASLFNLVAVCHSEADRDRASEIISAVTVRHPCRAIVLLADETASSSGMTASITAHCHLAGGGRKQVCCEQISITANGAAAVTQTAPTVLSLLESDLPTVLWWQGNFLQHDRLFRRLVGVADRLIYDTSVWEQPVDLAALSAAITEQRRCHFADLSWTRLASWRKLTADFFDDATCRSELDHLQRIAIELGGGPGAMLRGRLYGAWIAAQLGWTEQDLQTRLKLIGNKNPDTAEQGFMSVTLKSPRAQFLIHKNYGESTAITRVTMPDACGLPRKRALWSTDDVALLSEELDHNARHVVYEKAVGLVGTAR